MAFLLAPGFTSLRSIPGTDYSYGECFGGYFEDLEGAERMGRMSIMFSFSAFAGAFSGLLAAAVVNMDGVGGRPGWAWIFIIVCCSLPLQRLLHNDSLTTACALGRVVFDIVWAYGHGLPAKLTFDSPDLDGE